MADKAIFELDQASSVGVNDYLLVSKSDPTSSTGYTSMKLPSNKVINVGTGLQMVNGVLSVTNPGGGGSGVQAFDVLWTRGSSTPTGSLTLSSARNNYTGLVFVFKKNNKYSTIFKTNNEIDLAINNNGSLVLDKLLSGTIPVVGNGKVLGLTNGNGYTGGMNFNGYGYAINNGTLDYPIGPTDVLDLANVPGLVGVVTDGTKSGIQVDMSQATGIELTAITNTTVTLSDYSTISSIYGITLVGGSSSGTSSGGVIDGTILNNPSTDKVIWTAGSSVKKSYTVKNDCLLYCFFNGNEEIFKYTINDAPLAFFWEVAGTYENFSVWVPVKAGSVIKTWHPTSESNNAVYPYTSDGQITFTEYKLISSTNSKAAFPDYDNGVDITLDSNKEYTATEDGYIVVFGTNATSVLLSVNNNLIIGFSTYTTSSSYPIPISKGQVFKVTIVQVTGTLTCKFYPCK